MVIFNWIAVAPKCVITTTLSLTAASDAMRDHSVRLSSHQIHYELAIHFHEFSICKLTVGIVTAWTPVLV